MAQTEDQVRAQLPKTGANAPDEFVLPGVDPSQPLLAQVNDDLSTPYQEYRVQLAQQTAANEMLGRVNQRRAAEAKPAEAEEGAEPTTTRSLGQRAGAVVADVAKGATETPRAIVGGLRDAAQSAIAMTEELGNYINTKLPLGGIQFVNKDGEVDVKFMSTEEMQSTELSGLELPGINDPSSTTGKMVKGIVQFAAGFVGAGKITALQKLGGVGGAAAKGAVADFSAFEGDEKRLSNLVQEFPALQNPVTEYLAATPDDGAAEGRFKNAIEGLGLGVVTDAFVKGVRAFRQVQVAKQQSMGSAEAIALPRELPEDAFRELGDDAVGPKAALVRNRDFGVTRNPDVADGFTRLYRGEPKSGLIGEADTEDRWFHRDPKAAEWYARQATDGGRTTYVDVPTSELNKFASSDQNHRFYNEETIPYKLPPDVASQRHPTGSRHGANETFINFARIDAPEDVKRAMQEIADASNPAADSARARKRTFAQVQLDAAHENGWTALANRRQGQPLDDAQTLAARQLWVATTDKVTQLGEMAAANPSEANLFAFRKMLEVHDLVQSEVLGARASAARSLASWRIPAGGNAERLRDVSAALEASGGSEVARELAKRISALGKAGLYPEMSEAIQKTAYAKTRDAVIEGWIMGLLSGPKTHIVNMMSNTSVIGMNMYERGVAAQIGKLLGDEASVAVGEGTSQLFGIVEGFKDALRFSYKTAKTGESGFGIGKIDAPQVGSISSEAFGISNTGWIGQAVDGVGNVVRIPGRALQAEDEFFKTIGYRMEVNAQALRMARDEVVSGKIPAEQLKARIADLKSNPPENLRMAAVDQAMYQTFTNAPGKLAEGLSKMANNFPLVRILLPFIRTPANIMKFTFERTPLAPFMKGVRADISAGGARRDLAWARMGTGTAIMMTAADMSMNGSVSGAGPSDPTERAAMVRAGWQPYSVKSGDRWYAYNRLDPIGSLMGLAADMTEISANADPDSEEARDIEKVAVAMAASIGANVMNKTYMSGISEFFEMMSDPTRYSAYWAEGLAGSVVPTGVAEVRRLDDPYMREVRSMVDAMKNRTPGLSEGLPKRRDLWGRPLSYQSGMGATYDMFSPIYSRKENPEPIDKEILSGGTFSRGGSEPEGSFNISMPSRQTAFNGSTVNLDLYPGAYSRYLELAGNGLKHPAWGLGAKDLLNQIVSGNHALSQVYEIKSDGPEGGKETYVRDIVNQYRDLARKQILEEYPAIRMEVEGKQEKRRALKFPTIN